MVILGRNVRNALLVGISVLTTACDQPRGIGGDAEPTLAASNSFEMASRSRLPAVSDILQSTNPAMAAQSLERLNCASIDLGDLKEVRQVWRMRETSSAESAINDPLVRTLVAKCIVEAPVDHPDDSADIASAAQTLRKAMSNSDPQIAIDALLALPRIATSDDVEKILNLGLHRNVLLSATVTALSAICTPEARRAIETLKSAYQGTNAGQSIQSLLDAQRKGGQTNFCSERVTGGAEGVAEAATYIGKPPENGSKDLTAHQQVSDALNSPNPELVLQQLLDLHCSSENLDSVSAVRRAWTERSGREASATTRNRLVQAIMARCLLEAEGYAHDAGNDVAAAEALLRTDLESEDTMTVVVAMDGLVVSSKYEDLISVARVLKRFPKLRNVVVRELSVACGSGAISALSEVREGVSTSAERASIDAIYERFASDRARCVR